MINLTEIARITTGVVMLSGTPRSISTLNIAPLCGSRSFAEYVSGLRLLHGVKQFVIRNRDWILVRDLEISDKLINPALRGRGIRFG